MDTYNTELVNRWVVISESDSLVYFIFSLLISKVSHSRLVALLIRQCNCVVLNVQCCILIYTVVVFCTERS
jgi:hypothetical protein